jgi:hypothetical protein
LEHLADPGHDPLAVWEQMVFEDGAIGYGTGKQTCFTGALGVAMKVVFDPVADG